MASKNYIGLARITEIFTLIKNTLHRVAFSGSYNDLDDKPTTGHIIENPSGTDMTQRANLQFVDAGVSDDSVNDKTKVEMVQTISAESDLTNAPDGVYQGTWDEDVSDVLTADMVGYGAGTVEDALDGNKLIDVSNSVTLTADVSEGAILAKYCKVTNQLFLIATTRIKTTSTGSMSNITIANIASAYRPSYDVKIPVYSATGGNDGISMLYINTSGSVELTNIGSSATSFYARFNVSILLG